MKQIFIIIFFCFFVLLWTVPLVCASKDARQFIQALEAYQAEEYAKAAAGFSAIIQGGVRNANLFYNLGNAYFKQDDLGRALLWYERALKMAPHDPDLRFNYEYARSLTKDAVEEEMTSLWRIFFFWKFQLSQHTIILAAVVLNMLFWVILAAWRFTHRSWLRRTALVVLVPAVVMVLTGVYNYYESGHQQQAIVLPPQVSVRSGMDDASTELFILHAGAKVTVMRQMDGYCQIRFTLDKIGWVKQEAVGVI